eukprot:m.267028 g.267028  ORF g.267028 m.267028 type:complete len:523 (+) comp11068_c2_seq1:1655-3223(+)
MELFAEVCKLILGIEQLGNLGIRHLEALAFDELLDGLGGSWHGAVVRSAKVRLAQSTCRPGLHRTPWTHRTLRMKIKVLSRDSDDYERKSSGDLHQMPTNAAPELHPFEEAREYKRALNAVKLERVFAKPFLAGLDGHTDGVQTLAKHPHRVNTILSGAADGEVRIWNLSTRKCTYSAVHHRGFVRGICVTPDAEQFITVGVDKVIRITRMDQVGEDADEDAEASEAPITLLGKSYFTGIDHHRSQDLFATSGEAVELWSQHRSEPVQTFSWGADTINTVKFNPVETNVFASAADDRNVVLYDVRTESPIRKVILAMRTNAICWNPMEAFNFTAANEDHNLYTFDMRKLDHALNVHKDHVSAVMDIDYSPTGKSFVSGSYDRTVRIFDVTKGHSREVYHTKRMQRIFTVKWTLDSKYLLSGSDETNIRVWKAVAWDQMGPKTPRQMSALNYSEKLKKKFQHHPEIKRIARHRHTPKEIYHAQRIKREMESARTRKGANKRKYSKDETPILPARKKAIVEEEQ